MPKMARVEVVGVAHHVIQRGNRNQRVFFSDGDKRQYLKVLKMQSDLFDMKIWAYCLMDNHVHLVVVPQKEGSMTKAVGETHRLYTRMINFRKGWKGFLWQGRFKSFPMDAGYLYHCVRYVERNPVRACMVKEAEYYEFSSAATHVSRKQDPLLESFYLHDEIRDWRAYLHQADEEERLQVIRRHIFTGRPLGEQTFVERLEQRLGRVLRKMKPGPRKQCVSEDV
jgi:putative transposase